MNDRDVLDRGRYLYGTAGLHPDALKVLFLAADATGCSWYRGRQPAFRINQKYPDKINQAISRVMIDADENPKQDDTVWDIVVHQRQYDPQDLAWAKRMSTKHKTINGYESDDDFWNIDAHSSVKDMFNAKRLKEMEAYVRGMDYVTVSTEALKVIYEKLCPRVEVIPNAIEFEIIDKLSEIKKSSDEVIVGWSGTTTHISDLKIIIPVIAEILNKYKNVIFEIGGWPNCPLLKALPAAQVRRAGWTNNMTDYYRSLKGRDIALAPLVSSIFNDSKSNIKYLESAACGVPVIASDVTPYAKTIDHGVNGFMVKNGTDVQKLWKQTIEALINDAGLRRSMGEAGAKTVRENFNQEKVADKWAELYKRVAKKTSCAKQGV